MVEDSKESQEISMNEILNQTFQDSAEEGELVAGRVLEITKDIILIDLGLKCEGIIPSSQVASCPRYENIKIGDAINVLLLKKEGNSGRPLISFTKAEHIITLKHLKDMFMSKMPVEGRIISKVKGGLIVDIGINSFLPASQIGLSPVKNLDNFIGQTIKIRIIEFNLRSKNIVVSERIFLEEERRIKKDNLFKTLKEGDVITGIVKNITSFGAFIDIGGIDGLLHIKDISWRRVRKVEDLLKINEELEVKVLTIDTLTEKISLGIKQLTPHPWENIEEKYPVGSVVSGRVSSLTNFGAFVELEEGVEGLVHISEMSWTEFVNHPSKIVSVGDIIQARVLHIDLEKKKLSLGFKQVHPNPWENVDQKYPVGAKISGTVTSLVSFGAFIRLEEGIEGLVHITDMSWAGKIKHPRQLLKKDQDVEVIVLSVDTKDEKISLGIKQLESDPYSRFSIGKIVHTKVSRLVDYGAFVKLEDGIEGLIHISQISRNRLSHPKELLEPGSEITAKIIKIDKNHRRIDLSITAYEKDEDKSHIKKYMNPKIKSTTIGDLINAEIQRLKDTDEQEETNE